MNFVLVAWEIIQTVILVGVAIVVSMNREELEDRLHRAHMRLMVLENHLFPELNKYSYDDDEETEEDNVVQGESVGDSGTGEVGAVDGEQAVPGTGEQPKDGTV